MARILVVEDEAHLAEGLQFNLEAEDHEVVVASDGAEALERILAGGGAFDLVLLDLMLPGLSGFEVLRRMRAAGVLAPVLVLTAKDETADRVRGLLRRRRWDGAAEPAAAPPLQIGVATVHFDRFELDTPQGPIRLTTREAGLLRALADREGEAVTRGELLEAVWGLRPDTNTRVVDSFVVRLRRYLEPDPSRPRHIVSVRGHGYRLVR